MIIDFGVFCSQYRRRLISLSVYHITHFFIVQKDLFLDPLSDGAF